VPVNFLLKVSSRGEINMATKDVKLPDIGEGVTEGEMVKWLVKIGDIVKADQPIAEVMTDKATVEVPSPVAGVVKEFKVKEGDIVPIETTLLVLEASGASTSAAPAATAKSSHVSASAPKAAAPAMPAASTSVSASATAVYPPAADVRVLATPATRRLARETNIDVNTISGSGLAGRVTREDVMRAKGGAGAIAAGQPTFAGGAATSGTAAFAAMPVRAYVSTQPGGEERVPLRGIRRKIAEQMQTTKQIVPHFTIMDEANVTELVRLRTQSKEVGEKYGVKVTYLPFVMKALISTMREFPMFNASIDDQAGEIVYKKYFNIGFAADTPNGLLVPVIKNVDQKTILEISKEITDLAKKARDGKLSLDEMKGATITITNIGSVGGTYATPIINHPEVAIIGMYKVDWKPVYKDGQFVPTQVMNFTATCDHRLIDGAVAANFLKAFLKRIENVGHLVLDMV
jgi:pyruvate dehydrogenase E2 component (dihydrolipoamide acetyltransferase)